jgi:2-keto-4-pentenoate hydratase
MTNIADTVWRAMQTGEYANELEPLDIAAGQQLQLEMLSRWQHAGEQLGGFKIGLTSGQARNSMGDGIRPFGFILQSRILQSGDAIEHSLIGKMGVENELVFNICADIKADKVTPEVARSVVDGVAPGFEINQPRLQGTHSNGLRIADNLTQWGIVVGDFVHPDQNYDDLNVVLSNDDGVLQQVAAATHIDNHFASIAALINGLYQYNMGLTKGMKVITGSYTRQSVKAAGRFIGDFGSIGSVELEVK